jgi:RNA polymerase sigma-70 factor (ECF subfamily)
MAVVTATPPANSVRVVAPASDEQLLASHAAGDRLALEEVFRRYRQPAFRVAHRLLGNEADALDAVQDGFVKVLTHLTAFEGRSSFKTWLLRVVSNAALDLGRQRGRRATAEPAADAAKDSVDGPLIWDDPTLGLERADLRRRIDAALARLPETQRQAFVLHVDADLSYREIAESLGISIGTVMSRLYYARQKLRAYLSPLVKT